MIFMNDVQQFLNAKKVRYVVNEDGVSINFTTAITEDEAGHKTKYNIFFKPGNEEGKINMIVCSQVPQESASLEEQSSINLHFLCYANLLNASPMFNDFSFCFRVHLFGETEIESHEALNERFLEAIAISNHCDAVYYSGVILKKYFSLVDLDGNGREAVAMIEGYEAYQDNLKVKSEVAMLVGEEPAEYIKNQH